MYNTEQVGVVAVSESPRAEVVTISDVDRFLALGERRGWDFDVLGQAPLPHERVQLDGWLVIPADQDLSAWPTRTVERVNALFDAGLRPRGFVVIHELPSETGKPAQDRFKWPQLPSLPPDLRPRLTQAARAVGLAILGVGVLAGAAVLAVAAIAAATVLLIPMVLLGALAGLDPILVAVTQDGYWVEIDRWNEKEPEDDGLAAAIRRHFGG